MSQITVKAAPGVRVPREENARRYIDDAPVHVERTAYYLRQISAGDLVIVPDEKAVSGPNVKTKAEANNDG
ncbi:MULTISPECIES: DUF2635 domain-containing protein [Dickeya]|uniref:DUF2635 domain-containing protein n=1 Tax=Dickeya aquatica TaxID=1401087 RepID=A0A375A9K2_9GAMM|nr:MULTISPECIES: DUF2635 domain-containing protein [Dickeya]SLM62631.1 hypothetical protein DAQ1742_01689 [Dickeya aquatica]SLM64017.1 hypothetical protein DAQ1742_03194 [Dickeya aquatica]SLM64481.1 hypothetical protein DAQ1742_03687 [Dickeya aquatica]